MLLRSGQPWYADAVAQAFRSSSKARRLADSDAERRGYLTACAADGMSPLPITLDSVEAWWAYRVIGCGLKSSALKSATSRLLAHAALLGYTASTSVIGAVWEEHIRFRAEFPCEVSSLAPPRGNTGSGNLMAAIEFAGARASASFFFRCL